jgi:hypothetical protein
MLKLVTPFYPSKIIELIYLPVTDWFLEKKIKLKVLINTSKHLKLFSLLISYYKQKVHVRTVITRGSLGGRIYKRKRRYEALLVVDPTRPLQNSSQFSNVREIWQTSNPIFYRPLSLIIFLKVLKIFVNNFLIDIKIHFSSLLRGCMAFASRWLNWQSIYGSLAP